MESAHTAPIVTSERHAAERVIGIAKRTGFRGDHLVSFKPLRWTPGWRGNGRAALTSYAINYGGMAIYKIGILLFNLAPLIALCLVRKGS